MRRALAELISSYQAQLNLETLFVADAALYNEQSLRRLGGLNYICRVPQTIERARELLAGLKSMEFRESRRGGYRVAEVSAEYAGIEQRWIAVESERRAKRELSHSTNGSRRSTARPRRS